MLPFLTPRLLAVVLAAALVAPTLATAGGIHQPITGAVEIIDGDSLIVGGVRIRLRGLDAPELDHPGGEAARRAMQEIIGGHSLNCWADGTHTHDRTVSTCFVTTVDHSDVDIARELIRRGYALDCARYSQGKYAPYETDHARLTLKRASYCRTRSAQ
jgi:micrococcal nuclease